MGDARRGTKDFNAARDKTAAYVKETKDDCEPRRAASVLKTLDGYQWVLLIAAHSARHTAQIEEVKAAPRINPRSSDGDADAPGDP